MSTSKNISSGSVFSFFSGGGFLDLGFETQGFKTVFVNEIHKPFLDAYVHARKKLKVKQPVYGFSNTDISNLTNNTSLLKSLLKEEELGN